MSSKAAPLSSPAERTVSFRDRLVDLEEFSASKRFSNLFNLSNPHFPNPGTKALRLLTPRTFISLSLLIGLGLRSLQALASAKEFLNRERCLDKTVGIHGLWAREQRQLCGCTQARSSGNCEREFQLVDRDSRPVVRLPCSFRAACHRHKRMFRSCPQRFPWKSGNPSRFEHGARTGLGCKYWAHARPRVRRVRVSRQDRTPDTL